MTAHSHPVEEPVRKRLYPDFRPSGIRKHWDHCSMVANSTGDLLRKRGIPESYGDPIEAVAWFDNKIGALCVAVADYSNGKRVTYRVGARDWVLDIETIRP